MSCPLLQRGAEHGQAAKSLNRTSRRTASVGPSVFGSNALIVFDENRMWLLQSVSTAHNRIRRAGLTKGRAYCWRHEYSVWPSTCMHHRGVPMISFVLMAILMHLCFVLILNAVHKSLPLLHLKQLFSSKEALVNISWSQVVRYSIYIFLIHANDFKTFWSSLFCHSQWLWELFLTFKLVLIK